MPQRRELQSYCDPGRKRLAIKTPCHCVARLVRRSSERSLRHPSEYVTYRDIYFIPQSGLVQTLLSGVEGGKRGTQAMVICGMSSCKFCEGSGRAPSATRFRSPGFHSEPHADGDAVERRVRHGL